MAKAVVERCDLLPLLQGPVMNIMIKAPDGEISSWNLPCALLKHYSGYFQRMKGFKEAKEGAVELGDQETRIFGYFVEFLYYRRYTTVNTVENGIHEDARAWVLGDYLDATAFRDHAMRNLYEIYLPDARDSAPEITPEMIDYCYSNTVPGSALRGLYKSIAVRHWHDAKVIILFREEQDKWSELCRKHSDFIFDVLFYLNGGSDYRIRGVDTLKKLIQAETEDEDMGK